MTAPIWITASGFLGTFTERITTSTSVMATGTTTISYSLISGQLPTGIRINNAGTIYGTIASVPTTVTSTFVIRATNTVSNKVSDRTFYIVSEGPTEPTWMTPLGMLTIGPSGEKYAINKKYIEYQLTATQDVLVNGQSLNYYIKDQAGLLPPGISLSPNGLISGYINDILSYDSSISLTGGYDLEKYDKYPYDHVTIIATDSSGSTLNYISKIYQFNVTVSDGYVESTRYFELQVDDPAIHRVYSPTYHYDGNTSYIIGPQWLTPGNLGSVRSDNNEVIKLQSYDPYPSLGPLSYGVKTGSNLPPYWTLSTTTGVLSATLPYLPEYSYPYSFSLEIIKQDTSTTSTITTRVTQTFSLTVLGLNTNEMYWISDSTLTTLTPGEVSELRLSATATNFNGVITYSVTQGSLPVGLNLVSDGSITGRVAWESQTYIDLEAYGFDAFKLDGGTTTLDRNYGFTATAVTEYGQSVTKQFTIPIVENSLERHTRIWMRPLWTREERAIYQDFTSNPNVFPQDWLYRPLDLEFGIQSDPKIFVEFGLGQVELDRYAEPLSNYLGRVRLYAGEIKTAQGKDSSGNHLYDVVYVDMVDPLSNPAPIVDAIYETVYPNNIPNIKGSLESITTSGSTILVDEYMLPKYMRTDQEGLGVPLGYITALVLCFVKPGFGTKLIKNITNTGFDFKQFNYELDRIVIEEPKDYTEAKYVMINH